MWHKRWLRITALGIAEQEVVALVVVAVAAHGAEAIPSGGAATRPTRGMTTAAAPRQSLVADGAGSDSGSCEDSSSSS